MVNSNSPNRIWVVSNDNGMPILLLSSFENSQAARKQPSGFQTIRTTGHNKNSKRCCNFLVFLIATVAICGLIAFVSSKHSDTPATAPKPPKPEVSFSLKKMQRLINNLVDPCGNFYQYACDGVIEGREESFMDDAIKQVMKFSLAIHFWQNDKAPKMFKEFGNYYKRCSNFVFKNVEAECAWKTMKLFDMPLGLAVMEEYDLLNISQSILNSTLLAMKEMVNESDWLIDYSKMIANDLTESTKFQLGLPTDFASWDLYHKIDDFCKNTSVPHKACPKVISRNNNNGDFGMWLDNNAKVSFNLDSLYETIYKRKPFRFV